MVGRGRQPRHPRVRRATPRPGSRRSAAPPASSGAAPWSRPAAPADRRDGRPPAAVRPARVVLGARVAAAGATASQARASAVPGQPRRRPGRRAAIVVCERGRDRPGRQVRGRRTRPTASGMVLVNTSRGPGHRRLPQRADRPPDQGRRPRPAPLAARPPRRPRLAAPRRRAARPGAAGRLDAARATRPRAFLKPDVVDTAVGVLGAVPRRRPAAPAGTSPPARPSPPPAPAAWPPPCSAGTTGRRSRCARPWPRRRARSPAGPSLLRMGAGRTRARAADRPGLTYRMPVARLPRLARRHPRRRRPQHALDPAAPQRDRHPHPHQRRHAGDVLLVLGHRLPPPPGPGDPGGGPARPGRVGDLHRHGHRPVASPASRRRLGDLARRQRPPGPDPRRPRPLTRPKLAAGRLAVGADHCGAGQRVGQPSATSAAIRRPWAAPAWAAPIRFDGSSTLRPMALSEALVGGDPGGTPRAGAPELLRKRVVLARTRAAAARPPAPRRSRSRGRRWRASACRRRRSGGRRSRPAARPAGPRSSRPRRAAGRRRRCGRRRWKEPLSASTAVIRRSRSGQSTSGPSLAAQPRLEDAQPLGRPGRGAPCARPARSGPARCGRCPGASSAPSRVSIARGPNSAPSSAGAGVVCSAYRSSRSSLTGEPGADDRAGRGADDRVGAGHVDPAVTQALEQADLPGDAGDAAAAEHQAGSCLT